MKEENLKFTIEKDNGEIAECDILSIFPKDDIESYVVFFDDERDEVGDIVLKYGKLVQEETDYTLKTGVSEEELEYIKDNFYDELVDLSSSIMEEYNG